MRNNQPVNQKEYRMQQGDILVSKTDLKGRLTYVNEAFCKIAGMTEEELIGKPHNVVRHPDMPSSAFADLWETVQAGKPWTGFVKNRSADGGFYWVKANVAPDYNEKGNIIGYISVRTYPTRDEINTYSSLYKNVNAGKETLSSSLRFPFLRSIKVKTKMLLVSVLSTLTMLGLLWLVYADMSKAITKGEMQLKGLAYAVGVRQVMEHLPQHRGMANEYLNGNTNLKDRIKMEVQQVDQALEVLVAAEKQYADDLGASGMVADIVKKWSKISTRWKYLSSEESFAKHTSLTNDLLDLSIHTGGTSGFLSSDSMIASMSARVLSVESVRLIEYLGKLRGLGAGVAAKGDVSNTEKAALIKADVSSDIMLEQVVASLSEAVMASKVEGMEINKVDFVQVLENMRRSGQIFSTMAKQTLINSDQINISSKVYFNTGSKAIASTLEMFDEVAKETKEHLKLSLRHNTNTLHMILWVSTLSVLFTIILLFMVVRATLAPLAVVNHVLKSIVSNNYSTDCTKNQNDEMGDVLDLIKVTQSRLQFEIFESRHASMKQKEIDGKRRKDEQLEDLALAETFESDVGSLVTTLSGNASAVHKSMKNLSAIADALNDQAQDAITGVSSSSDYVGTTAAAIEEMSISVASVVDQINETLNVSEQAVKEANDTAKIMQELVTASEEIGSVVATISDIAEQTNLLALNASIEAARAGDARRGFAVVAGEVKELANQTSKATGQIRNKVEHIQMQSREAGQAIGEIHGIIEKVNAYSSHVAAAMVQQSEATREMSSGAQQASASMHDVQVSVGEVTSAATEVDDSAEANLALVEEMLEQMNAVQVQVEAFVARLKG